MEKFDEIDNIANNVAMAKKHVIALVDCDSFFVSCEQANNPELKGKPVCVMSGRGQCVISRSKEAKKLGIETEFTVKMAQVVIDSYKAVYPELEANEKMILEEFDREEK